MRGFSSVALLAASSLATAASSSPSSNSTSSSSTAAAAAAAATPSCAKGLYMVVARGSEEDPGPGSSAFITSQVQKAIPDSVVAPVDYPATLTDYEGSESKGVTAMHGLLEAYNKACPSSLMAIVGYSQGAQIGMDATCGGLGGTFTSQAAVSSAVLDKVVAVNVFGDPTHIAGLAYDVGTSTNDGLFPRNNSAECLKHKDKIISFCDHGDVYCDSGVNITVHHLYLDRYGDQMVSFIVDKYNAAKDAASKASNTAATSGTSASHSSSAGPTSTVKATSSDPASNAGVNLMGPSAGLVLGAAVVTVLTSALSSLL